MLAAASATTVVQGEHLAVQLQDLPARLDEFVADVSEVYSPGRACNVLTDLGRLLLDEHPDHPQSGLDRARPPGRPLGPLARSQEAFFTEGCSAMRSNHRATLGALEPKPVGCFAIRAGLSGASGSQ